MNSSHRRVALGFTAILVTTLCSTNALAGCREISPLNLDLINRFASGDLNSVRQAMDNRSKIGCSLNSDNVISCTAVNMIGTTVTCTRFLPPQAMVNAVLGLASDGYVYFAWNSSGTCTQIITEVSSKWAPKQP